MSEKKLNELKERVAELQEEIRELTPEELEQVFGGAGNPYDFAMNISTDGTNIEQAALPMNVGISASGSSQPISNLPL